MFSVSQLSGDVSFNGALSAEQVAMGELWWAFKQEANLNRYTPEQLDNATQWALWTIDPDSGNAGGADFNPYLGGSDISVLDATGLSTDSVIAQLSADENVVAFYPLVGNSIVAETNSFLDEPLFSSQWHLRNTGQAVGIDNFTQQVFGVPGEDINVVGAWNEGASGDGVVVAVVDNGVQFSHPDLVDNSRPDLSFDFVGGSTGAGANLMTQAGAHGTAVAGLIGADGDNGYGAVGVAPNADLASLKVGTGQTNALEFMNLDENIAQVISFRNDEIDIYNHSWGEGIDGRQTAPLGPMTVTALRNSVIFGRPGPDGTPLGNIHIFSSGNDGGHDFPPAFPGSGNWDSADYSGFVSSRYTIGVGAFDHDGTIQNSDGTFTNYPETGSSVLITAPSGSTSLDIGLDTGLGSGLLSTDTFNNSPADTGFNVTGTLDGDFLEETDFTKRLSGTSFSAPQVAGVVALMLEVNPFLSYRDVQEILMRSARQVDPMHESWQTNFIEVFQDPDTDPATGLPRTDPFIREDAGGVPSNYTLVNGAPPTDDYSQYNLARFDNGAGYTVSQSRGIFSEQVGYAHGALDAELAVQLAKQWHTKGQNNPGEVTYTTFVRQLGNTGGRIQSAAFVGPSGSPFRAVVPGSLGDGPDQDFAEYYQEFWNDMPFMNVMDLPVNDRGAAGVGAFPLAALEGFTPPLMEIEWMEVKVEIFGDTTDMNELRLALRSPDGTISDLNMFLETNTNFNVNNIDQPLRVGSGTSPADGGSPLIYTFSTNRHWGERSDSYFEIDPVTGLRIADPNGRISVDPELQPQTGQLVLTTDLVREWELVVENYSDSELTLDTFEIIFHGTPITGERISGKVGVDLWGATQSDPADGSFNFERRITTDLDMDGDIDIATADPNQEPFAGNITVRARDQANNIVDEFVTGADGNFYFDLAPGTYTIEVFDPLGRTAMQDAGLDPRYQEMWTVTIDDTDQFTHTAGRLVPIDENGDGIQDFDDANMNGVQDGNEQNLSEFRRYSDVNFLLDAGTQPVPEVDVSGFVYADTNVNGVFDGGLGGADSPAPGFRVYADLNHSGQFEQTEPSAFTDDNGLYTFTIDGITDPQDIEIRVDPINNQWLPTIPVDGVSTIFKGPGEEATDINFGFQPPPDSDPDNPPGDPGDPGTITGVVFNDRNANSTRDQGEGGVEGVRVFVDENLDGTFNFTDANSNGIFDEGDTALETHALTNEFGGYFLGDVDPGLQQLRIIVPPDYLLTAPLIGFREVTLVDGGQLNNIQFGVQNLATRDLGDLPDSYSTTLSNPTGLAGPSHEIVEGFTLGTRIDGEQNGQPSAGADADDLVGGDEDGILRNANDTLMVGATGSLNGALVPGVINEIRFAVAGIGGYLNVWMDFDRNGTFDAGEQVVVDADLNPGIRTVSFAVPANLPPGPIATRMRWGTAGLQFFGPSLIGEVEDYLIPTTVAGLATVLPGDYDGNGSVEQSDYDVWVNAYGTSNLAADGNGDGIVDTSDYTVWRDHLGQSAAPGGAALSGSAESSGSSAAWRGYSAWAAQLSASLERAQASIDLADLLAGSGAASFTYQTASGPSTVFGYTSPRLTSPAVSGGAALVNSTGGQESDAASESLASGGAALASRSIAGVAVPFTTTVSPQATTSSLRQSVSTAVNSEAELLILDELFSNAAASEVNDLDADPLAVRRSSFDEETSRELALATVFDEETDWRLGL